VFFGLTVWAFWPSYLARLFERLRSSSSRRASFITASQRDSGRPSYLR
jgi:hypothetical protein